MGKARQAPAPTYQRTFVITNHALQRYRERVEKEHAARSDFDLGNVLDERIKTAEKHQTIIDTRNIDSVTRVFEVEHRDGTIYYAVVRDQTVVTVLDREMMDVNFENGSWKRGPMNTPFAGITLRGVVPEETVIPERVLKRSERQGPPPGVPSIADALKPLVPALDKAERAVSGVVSALVSHVVEPDIVAAASMRVGQAALACKRAEKAVKLLEQQLKEARDAVEVSLNEYASAQLALAEAVEKAAEETT